MPKYDFNKVAKQRIEDFVKHMIKLFAKIINSFQPLTIFLQKKPSITDVRQRPEYASLMVVFSAAFANAVS